jgi:hypothetical protein
MRRSSAAVESAECRFRLAAVVSCEAREATAWDEEQAETQRDAGAPTECCRLPASRSGFGFRDDLQR